MNTVSGNLVADLCLPTATAQPVSSLVSSFWHRLVRQVNDAWARQRRTAGEQANALRLQVRGFRPSDRRLAADLRAVADRHEHQHER